MECNGKEDRIWKSMWIVIIWSIWNQRNRITFRNELTEVEEVFNMS